VGKEWVVVLQILTVTMLFFSVSGYHIYIVLKSVA